MIIQKRRINNVGTYLKRLGDIERFYVCVKNSSKNREVLRDKKCMYERLKTELKWFLVQ